MSPLASNLREDWIRIATSLVEEIAQEEPVLAAFLFGSVAWNDADAASDLDLMILVDREPPFREVTRIPVPKRVHSRVTLRPEFADLDRMSKAWFFERVRAGAWAERLMHCVILSDRDGSLAALRDFAVASFVASNSRSQRFSHLERSTTDYFAAAAAARTSGDAVRAALADRMALETAATALIGAAGERFSSAHFLETVARILRELGETSTSNALVDAFMTASVDRVAVPGPFEGWMSRTVVPRPIADGITAYYILAEALKTQMMRASQAQSLSATDQAWAAFTFSPSTYQEMAAKVDKMLAVDRAQALQFYLQCLLLGPIRINFGRLYALDLFGSVRKLTPLEFFEGIRSDLTLSSAWVTGLGLHTQDNRTDSEPVLELVRHLLSLGHSLLEQPIGRDGERFWSD